MLSCFKMLLNKTYWDKIYSTFLYLVLQTPTDDSYLMVEKNKKEKKPYILFYKRCLKECHVVNFVIKIKPGEKKDLQKQYPCSFKWWGRFFPMQQMEDNRKCIQLTNLL